jgi:RNA-directed DNA polymerase
MAQCCDRIDPPALLAQVPAPPRSRRPLKAWLKAGLLADGSLAPPTAGTPQGGSCAPLLALIARHGMDKAITRVSPHARVIAYADDGVVLHAERQVLAHCQELLKTWLAEMGRSLNEAKSRIYHT